MTPLRPAVLLVLALLAVSAPVRAGADASAAQTAFDEGMALMEAGDYAGACRRLANSHALDPGMATLFRLGECYEKLGQIALARRTFDEVARTAAAVGMVERERFARDRADALEPRLSRVTVVVRRGVRRLPGLLITLDGAALTPAEYNEAIAVDVGVRTITATAPGHRAWKGEVQVEGEKQALVVAIPELASLPQRERPSAPVAGMVALAAWGVALVSVGGTGVGAGIAMAVVAKNAHENAAPHCTAAGCDAEGFEAREEARSLADAATGVLIGSAAVGVAGVLMWVLAPSQASDSVVTVSPLGVSFAARF